MDETACFKWLATEAQEPGRRESLDRSILLLLLFCVRAALAENRAKQEREKEERKGERGKRKKRERERKEKGKKEGEREKRKGDERKGEGERKERNRKREKEERKRKRKERKGERGKERKRKEESKGEREKGRKRKERGRKGEMALVIGGISQLFQPTIAVLSAEKICQGTNLWYFLIGLHMVTLFFAYGPWDSLKADLVCCWPSNIEDANKFCLTICYNQRFPVPISGFWVFHFIAIIFTVALLKFVYVTKKSPKDKDAEAARKPISGTESSPKVGEQLHFGGWRQGIYIFCIALLLAIDIAFIWTLLGLQLPNLIQEVTTCYPNDPACPATAQFAVNSISDKRAILWVLAFCSAANIIFCIGKRHRSVLPNRQGRFGGEALKRRHRNRGRKEKVGSSGELDANKQACHDGGPEKPRQLKGGCRSKKHGQISALEKQGCSV
ncbi:hypothetical protein NXF25_018766 [Crotalus adamanteus]|uniref:Connexin N-terminal domain-containing protein n=1 Tax=Crotalus adamanteus TaxID=8729 RepID=A0AAW1AZJ5_CROAD